MNTTCARLAALLTEKGLLEAHTQLSESSDKPICGVDCDSRVVKPGHLFVCKGRAFRPEFLASAAEKGAVAYLCDAAHAEELAATCPELPAFVAKDLRAAMGIAAAHGWGRPDHELPVLGVTGTKGKSTVACMLRAILDAGHTEPRAGIMGSIDTFDGVEAFESVNTTPEAPDMWRHLANARKASLSHMVMEVSSQALKYDRVLELELAVGCFLNIGRDHISAIEHPNFEDYFESKLRIFDQCKDAVVNLDSEHAETILERAARCERVLRVSAVTDAADVWVSNVVSHDGVLDFIVHTPSWSGSVQVSMPGLFNVDNALAAIAICELIGVGEEQIRAGLAHVRVPGRMELLPTYDPKVSALVDYAHNKLSYQRFFSSVSKEFAGRAVIAVFGAPGDKAHERRRELPEEASRWSDYLIYTEEDPAHEEVADICAEMAAATPAGQTYEVICDREAAIVRSVELAFAAPQGAIVCLLAKGDETRQHRGDAFEPVETDASIFERAVKYHHELATTAKDTRNSHGL